MQKTAIVLLVLCAAVCSQNIVQDAMQQWSDGDASGITVTNCVQQADGGGCDQCDPSSTFNGIECIVGDIEYPWKQIMTARDHYRAGRCTASWAKGQLGRTRSILQYHHSLNRIMKQCRGNLRG